MTRVVAPRLASYTALAAIALVAALATGRADLVALAAPFALYVLVALAAAPEPALRFGFALSGERVVEGDELEAELTITTSTGVGRLDLALPVPPQLVLEPEPLPVALRLKPAETRTLSFGVRCARWGAYAPGELSVRIHDRFELVRLEGRVDCSLPLRVYPTIEQLHALVHPLETQVFAGNEVARARGDGIEFADVRPFVHGDQVRRIDWRASARRQSLYVAESHPERNTDVVLFLDGFTDLRRDGRSTLDRTVRAAASLAAAYLERRDRVGVVGFGGEVRWLMPAMGDRQLYRLVESLLETEIAHSYMWRTIDVLPPRTLPPRALVIALSPLADRRISSALLDLRGRGFDLVVVELSPLAYVDAAESDAERLAHRLWPLWRDAVRYRFARSGVPVIDWREDAPLSQVVEEVIAYRRFARPVSA